MRGRWRISRHFRAVRDPPRPRKRSIRSQSHAADTTEPTSLLPAFIADYNARFAKLPANKKDLHRPLRAGDDLEDTFAWKEERTLSQALTLQYDKVIFILEPS